MKTTRSMTRDEAIEKVREVMKSEGVYSAGALVNILIALGVFTPDEPKPEPTPWERLMEEWPISAGRNDWTLVSHGHLSSLLDRAGLTLVHKKEGE